MRRREGEKLRRREVEKGRREEGGKAAWSICALLFAAAVALSILLVPRVEDIDSGSYRLMAAGEPACRPYANRVLHPLLARALASLVGPHLVGPRSCAADNLRCGDDTNRTTTAETAAPSVNHSQTLTPSNFQTFKLPFSLIALLSSIAFYLCVLSLLRDVRPRWWTFLLLISPLWWVWGGNIYIQDMFAAAFTAILFLVLRARFRHYAAAVFALLFLLQITRESTMVLAVALAAIAAWRREWRLAVGSLAAMLLGMAAVAWISRDALPNTNELGGFVYLVCKTVANGIRNLTGVIPWNDGYAVKLPWQYPDPPLWKCVLPGFLQMGNVHEVGVYAVNFKMALRTFAMWFLYFPGALLFIALRRRASAGAAACGKTSLRGRISSAFGALRGLPFHVQYAFVVGVLFWVLTPFSGASVERLAGYSWPLFWIALPWVYGVERREGGKVLRISF